LRHLYCLLFGCVISITGCDLQRLAVSQTAAVIKNTLPAFEGEWDYELASEAFPASIKTIEGLLVKAPDNQDLLLSLTRAYAAYALVVVEDRMEQAPEASAEADHQRMRARQLYLRAHRYGLRWLDQRVEGFSAAFAAGEDKLQRALDRCDVDDVPALFWSGMALASAINLGRDDLTLMTLLPKARAAMQRIVALDEGYYYGGAHLVLGSIWGSVGPAFGGDPKRAKQHFERALLLSKRRMLIVQEFYARTLALQQGDRAKFKALLREVLEAKLEINPQQKLANVTAKRRARRQLARINEYFD